MTRDPSCEVQFIIPCFFHKINRFGRKIRPFSTNSEAFRKKVSRGSGAEWEINITGTLLTGSAGGAQFFAGAPFSEFGRFYLGAVRSNRGYKNAYESYVNGDFAAICTKWGIEPLDLLHSKYRNYACFLQDDIHPTAMGYAAGRVPLFAQYFTSRL